MRLINQKTFVIFYSRAILTFLKIISKNQIKFDGLVYRISLTVRVIDQLVGWTRTVRSPILMNKAIEYGKNVMSLILRLRVIKTLK